MTEATFDEASDDPYEEAERQAVGATGVATVLTGPRPAALRDRVDDLLATVGPLAESGVGRRTTERLQEVTRALQGAADELTAPLEVIRAELYDDDRRAVTWSAGRDAAARTIQGTVGDLAGAYAEHVDVLRTEVVVRLADISTDVYELMRRLGEIEPDELRRALAPTSEVLLSGVESLANDIAELVTEAGTTPEIDEDGLHAGRLVEAATLLGAEIGRHRAELTVEDSAEGDDQAEPAVIDEDEVWARAAQVLECDPGIARRMIDQMARAPVPDEPDDDAAGEGDAASGAGAEQAEPDPDAAASPDGLETIDGGAAPAAGDWPSAADTGPDDDLGPADLAGRWPAAPPPSGTTGLEPAIATDPDGPVDEL